MTNFLFKIQTIIKRDRVVLLMLSKSMHCFLSVFFASKTKNPSHQ
ncbi:hypothetical protein NEICINOT_03499 [Neisseria cinerea ATCC 14685]|uniref:Uncharacterized protein n=1 Tax=Neisseria cinerea ATCC 14685 TaxID=546262 RepID=D0W1H6_NEICI|nr:hypothetical protein NEICINOT_03499 [Neisseria cinerea ATCC 14685]